MLINKWDYEARAQKNAEFPTFKALNSRQTETSNCFDNSNNFIAVNVFQLLISEPYKLVLKTKFKGKNKKVTLLNSSKLEIDRLQTGFQFASWRIKILCVYFDELFHSNKSKKKEEYKKDRKKWFRLFFFFLLDLK